MRPGEKLFEELLSKNPIKTKHPKIFRSEEPFIEHSKLIKEIIFLKKLIRENDLEKILKKLKLLLLIILQIAILVDHTFTNKK